MHLHQASLAPQSSAVRTALATAGLLMALSACSHFAGSAPSPDITTLKVSAHRLLRDVRLHVSRDAKLEPFS